MSPLTKISEIWRPVGLAAVVAGLGAIATLGLGALSGMGGSELVHLGLLLIPAVLITALAAVVAGRLLVAASVRQRLGAIALVGTTVGVVSLVVLDRLMVVSDGNIGQLATLAVYSLAAGGATAFAISRSSAQAIERLAQTAEARRTAELARQLQGADPDGSSSADARSAEHLGAIHKASHEFRHFSPRSKLSAVRETEV